MKFYTFWSFLLVLFIYQPSVGQVDTINLRNPSFEDIPRRGGAFSIPIRGWFDCSRIHFPDESPPDIHPVNYWSVTKGPSEGETYLGMVVRYNDSWEAVAQRLESPIESGKCYNFEIDLAMSTVYLSPTHVSQGREENFTEPAVLRVWGGNGICDRKELLGESPTITKQSWERYAFEFVPSQTHRFIIIEAFYKTPTLFPYNGHILADNASPIIQSACPGDEPLIAEVEETEEEAKPRPRIAKKKDPPSVKTAPDPEPEEVIVEAKPEKLLDQLDRDKIRKGQTIRIKNLYFEADTSSIDADSYQVLNEVFDFLRENKEIIVEIGGHTNGLPKHNYCDKLSTDRAREVASYLIRKGISPNRVEFKGYGKRKPIASNMTKEGRAKNQRVEIKILSLG